MSSNRTYHVTTADRTLIHIATDKAERARLTRRGWRRVTTNRITNRAYRDMILLEPGTYRMDRLGYLHQPDASREPVS